MSTKKHLDVVISDNIGVRCGCRSSHLQRGKVKMGNPVLTVLFDLEPIAKGKVNLAVRALCTQCEASWTWGQP